jgi:NADPH-dependent curcumin reductase
MAVTNRQIHLVSRPKGEAGIDNFRLVEQPVGEPRDGQVLVRHRYLSLDPYMRGRMDDAKSYAQPQPLDQVMQGGTAGVVVASRHPGYAEGDNVVGFGGWQEYSIVDASHPGTLRKVDIRQVPLSAYLGPVGMPGVTAWYGLLKICQPKAGQTIVVSAASGAVGSVVGQLAKARGCRAVGIAGGADKCGYVTGELGFDACVDYKAHGDPTSFHEALKAVTPDGVDGCFENVGGMVFDATLARMNAFGRIALCGMISGYDGAPIPLLQPTLLLKSRLMLQGFIVSEHMEVWPEALKELGERVASGTLKYRESVADGIAAAPEAFIGLLKGRNFGKQLVKVS